MNGKILDSTKFYKFGFHEKIVTQKHLPLQAFATSTLRNTIGRRALERHLLKLCETVLVVMLNMNSNSALFVRAIKMVHPIIFQFKLIAQQRTVKILGLYSDKGMLDY